MLNNGTLTTPSDTAMDLSNLSHVVSNKVLWMVLISPVDHDRYLIIMTWGRRERRDISLTQLNIKRAKWDTCMRHGAWKDLARVEKMTNGEAMEDRYGRIGAAIE